MEECEFLGEVHDDRYDKQPSKRIRGGWKFWDGSNWIGPFRNKKLALAARKEMLKTCH